MLRQRQSHPFPNADWRWVGLPILLMAVSAPSSSGFAQGTMLISGPVGLAAAGKRGLSLSSKTGDCALTSSRGGRRVVFVMAAGQGVGGLGELRGGGAGDGARVADDVLLGSRRLGKLREKARGFKTRAKEMLLDRLTISVEKDRKRAQSRLDEVVQSSVEGPDSFISEVDIINLIEKWQIEEGGGASAAPWMEQWAPGAELMDQVKKYPELKQLSELTVGRFNSLGKGDVKKAVSLMQNYVAWLNSAQWGIKRVSDVCSQTEGVPGQIKTGKCFITNGMTDKGNPLVIVKVAKHDPEAQSLDVTTRFVVHALFEAERLLNEPEMSQFAIVFDFRGASLKNVDYQAVKRFIAILTQFTPERLGMMLIYNAPGFFSAVCWPLIKPWLNPETAAKVHFVSGSNGLAEWIGSKSLPAEYGGEDSFDYDTALAKGLSLSELDKL